MNSYIDIFTSCIIDKVADFKEVITNKPFIAILFPATGFGASYIPNGTVCNVTSNPTLEFISSATPYLRFAFLILTILLTIMSFILQVKKLISKKDKKDNE